MSRLTEHGTNVRFWLKSYLFFGVALMILAMILYSNRLIGEMREHAESSSRLFSLYMSNVLFEVSDDGSLANLRKVIRESRLPIIITVLDGRPILWNQVPVDDRTEEDWDMLINMDVNNPPTPKLRRLVELYQEFDRSNDPIPIRVLGKEKPQGYVHFGQSPLQRELRLMPFIQLGIFLVFMGVAIQGLRYLKLSEQRSIWVGMAKETAHQLGTPLSAMLGWTQLIKDKARAGKVGDIESSVAEMEVDLQRLSKVSDRFSKIGSHPELQPVDIGDVVLNTASYFHRRVPSRKANSRIETSVGETPKVLGNEGLLEWVFENLVKNALDALGDGGGRVELRSTYAGGRHVEVYVSDTGRGIPAGQRDRVFRPGFTTKRRGWGLGLALTRRIVEDYHNGTIRLVESRFGRGTTFLVKLPVA